MKQLIDDACCWMDSPRVQHKAPATDCEHVMLGPDTRHASWETVAPAAQPRMLTAGVGPSTSTLLSAVSTSTVEKQRGTQGISNQSTFLHASRAVC